MIQKVCVIGAGIMGSSIAGVVASSCIPVMMLDIDDVANIAYQKMQNEVNDKLTHPNKIRYITVGNLDNDLDQIKDCDLIIEAIVELKDKKLDLYKKLAKHAHPNTILVSNTSTMLLKDLKQNMSEALRSRFLIAHFFNPVRYMDLVEIVSDTETDKEAFKIITDFCRTNLGKTVVRCKDSPGFIANRIGCFLMELTLKKALKYKINPYVADRLLINSFNLPSTGIFGLYDLIGIDVMHLITSSMMKTLPKSDGFSVLLNNYCSDHCHVLEIMRSKNLLGKKTKSGFYRIVITNGIKAKEVINLATLQYQQINYQQINYQQINYQQINYQQISDCNDTEVRVTDAHQEFVKEIIFEFYQYLFTIAHDIAHGTSDIDLVMSLGYNWKYGPFELLYSKVGSIIPTSHMTNRLDTKDNVFTNRLLRKFASDNQMLGDLGAQNRNSMDMHDNIHKDSSNASRQQLIAGVEFQNRSNEYGSLCESDTHCIAQIHTKMNCLSEPVFHFLLNSLEHAQHKQKKLIIFPSGKNFSAGADLKFILRCIEEKDWKSIDSFLKLGQNVMMAMRTSGMPVIACAQGFALGGGCEMLLHSAQIVAHSNLNAGLVEFKAGLIPAFGGLKEMFMRSFDEASLIKNLSNILMSVKSSSAEYFQEQYNVLNLQICMDKNSLLENAINYAVKKSLNSDLSIAKPSDANPSNSNQIEIPQVCLQNEVNVNELKDAEIVFLLQDIINLKHTDVHTLLEYERQIFKTLAMKPHTIDMIKSVL